MVSAPLTAARGGAEPAAHEHELDAPLPRASAAPQGVRDAAFVWQLLERIPDPELPVVSIRELGILRDVRLQGDGSADVIITPTYSGCPATEQITGDIIATLRDHGVTARVSLQLAPAWTTDWLSETARAKLRAYGIAPPGPAMHPAAHADGAAAPAPARVHLVARARRDAAVACPRCGSEHTVELSHFASTACKALYRCLDCREPFDHFKPH